MFGRGKKDKKAKAKPAKPKKEKKAKAKKAKPAKKKSKGPVKKRPTDVYTVMVLLSTAFVAISVIFLAMALTQYGFPSNMTPWK